VKPENILVNIKENQITDVKLSDFGFATKIDNENENDKTCGTHGYKAPEMLRRSEPYNEMVDCWSLGILLYNLVTGVMPFKGNDTKVYMNTLYKNPKYKEKSWK